MARGTTATGRKLRFLIILILLVAGALAILGMLGVGPDPDVEVADAPGIGRDSTIAVTAREPVRGLESMRVVLRQGEHEEVVAEQSFTSRPLWKLWGERTAEHTLEVPVGREHQDWLTNGEATLRVEARKGSGTFGEADPVVVERTLPVRVSPPSVQVASTFTYAGRGGSEAVVYRLPQPVRRHGVQSGEHFFRGWELPGQANTYFALFGVPWDIESGDAIRLVAEDELGNRAEIAFVDRFIERRVPVVEAGVSDAFLQKVVPEIAANSPGIGSTDDLLAAYLKINGDLRQRNAEQLIELGRKSKSRFLWNQAFLPFPDGQVMEAFAVRRHYTYNGEKVDEQTHLGFDLASTQQAPVPASNTGEVMYTGYFGIYGNTVILDHGYGLMTLYSHLSSMDVQPGDTVERGQALGRTGVTGLAAGDHLHFTTLLQGVPVTPVEWWDAHWIQDRLKRKLGDALPFGGSAPGAAEGAGGQPAAGGQQRPRQPAEAGVSGG